MATQEQIARIRELERNKRSKSGDSWVSKNLIPKSIEDVAYGPGVQGIIGVGDALSNQLSSAAALATSPITRMISPEASKPMNAQFGQGKSYERGRLVGDVAPYFAPGPQQETAIARMLYSGGLGALQNQGNPLKGAETGLTAGAIGEALPYAAKGIGKGIQYGANKFTRGQDMESALAEMAANKYASEQQAFSNLLPRKEGYAEKILSAGEIDKISNMVSGADLGPSVKKVYDIFRKRPTLENAHKLQSQLFESGHGLDLTKVLERNRSEEIQNIRPKVIDSIKSTLSRYGEEAPVRYQQYLEDYATNVGPYLQNKTLSNALKGVTEGLTPKKLSKELNLMVQKGEVPEGHLIGKTSEDLSKKLSRSDAYSSIAGGLAGLLYGGPVGAAVGAAIPKGIGILKPDLGFIQNREISRILSEKGASLYPPARKIGTAYKTHQKESKEKR